MNNVKPDVKSIIKKISFFDLMSLDIGFLTSMATNPDAKRIAAEFNKHPEKYKKLLHKYPEIKDLFLSHEPALADKLRTLGIPI